MAVTPGPFTRRATLQKPGLVTLAQVTSRTLAALNLYVDPTGNDANDGLSVMTPKLTPQAAFDLIPEFVEHPTVVVFAPGTYDVSAAGATLRNVSVIRDGSLHLSAPLVNATLATGTATGTTTGFVAADANGFAVVTDAAQSWTPNALRQKFFTYNGFSYPIASNTATTITIVGYVLISLPNGGAYSIQEPGVTLTCGSSDSGVECLELISVQSLRSSIGNFTGTNAPLSSGEFRVTGFRFLRTGTSSAAAVQQVETTSGFRYCVFENTSSGGGGCWSLIGLTSTGTAQSCVFDQQTTGSSGTTIRPSSTDTLLLTACIVRQRAPTAGTGQYLMFGELLGNVALSGTLFQRDTTNGGAMIHLAASCIRMGTSQLRLEGAVGATYAGFLVVEHWSQSGTPAPKVALLYVPQLAVQNMGVGVSLEGDVTFSTVATGTPFLSATNVTTFFEVKAGATLRFPGITPTVSGVTNEILLDGVATTFASVESASPKVVSNAFSTKALKA